MEEKKRGKELFIQQAAMVVEERVSRFDAG